MQQQHFGYDRIVELFDKDETAGSFLREDGEGGFSSGVYRMAREIERLRAIVKRADDYVADLYRHGTIDLTIAHEIRRKLVTDKPEAGESQ